jgi:hypothetical protein
LSDTALNGTAPNPANGFARSIESFQPGTESLPDRGLLLFPSLASAQTTEQTTEGFGSEPDASNRQRGKRKDSVRRDELDREYGTGQSK